jgi:cytochrome c-type biogenesis protein CcmH
LQQRLAANPGDVEGWVVLGRTLKSQQRYAEAQAALEDANRQVPDTPTIMVELAEARLFASGNPVITADIRQLLESAIALDPHQQKGLWLLGMAEAEDGNYAEAIATWQSLLGLLEPGSGSARRVSEQIAEAQALLGQPVPVLPDPGQEAAPQPAGPTTVAQGGIPVTIGIAPEMAGNVPGNAPLFVFIHPAGGAGMPLAVKRLAAGSFPMLLNFTDADLLQPGNSLQNFEQLDVSARIALGGSVNPTPGDIQAGKVTVNTGAVEPVTLHLDQRVQ